MSFDFQDVHEEDVGSEGFWISSMFAIRPFRSKLKLEHEYEDDYIRSIQLYTIATLRVLLLVTFVQDSVRLLR
jgi:hypothetical protein